MGLLAAFAQKTPTVQAVILEIKVAMKFRDLDAKCDEALQQIEENKYEAELKYDCFQKILKYGVAFCDKACRMKLEEG